MTGKKLPAFIGLLIFCAQLCAQIDLSAWPAEQLKQAKESSQKASAAANESDVIFYTNLARINGPVFVKLILMPYVEHNKVKKNSALQSLVTTLNSLPSLKPLEAEQILMGKARGYAQWAGKRGIEGHARFNQRLKALAKTRGWVGENCDYGNDDPLDIVIDLLIDDGIAGYGHRVNMLSKAYKQVGVGFAPHKKYRVNCVMDFSG